MLGHRVVTLSREIHAGLLARRLPEDEADLEKLGMPRIDMVCVDLYPLGEEIEKPGATADSVIEKTDIGGPTIISSAAKGRRIVVCDPSDRPRVITWLRDGKPNEEEFINELSSKADAIVSAYRLSSARYHSKGKINGLIGYEVLECKYGENAWQSPAGLFSTKGSDPLALDKFKIIAGTQPSYNNLCDLDRLLQTLTHIAAVFDLNRGKVPFIAVGAKHGNACGAAAADDPKTAIQNMLAGDPRAIFGGLVITNFPIDEVLAETLLTHLVPEGRRLLDGIIAPSFDVAAIEALKRKGDKCRFLVNEALANLSKDTVDNAQRIRYV